MKATLVSGKIPSGFEVVNENAVLHPTTKIKGALCKNKSAGIYVVIAAGIVSNCPQDWAISQDTIKQNSAE